MNVNCDRHCGTENYGDGSSVGIIGRLGVHDNDPVASGTPAVKNLIVTGSIYANRSVGGVVGKIGQTASGAIVENGANYASVINTDAKGVGGIVGAAWNRRFYRRRQHRWRRSCSSCCPSCRRRKG